MRGASPSGTRGAGTRESHFGGRHRTFRYRIRCWRGGAPFWASWRGTWHPYIDSRPLGALFIRIRGWSCTDRSSSRGPLHALPAALRPPQSEERSDQIRGTGVTRGPRRPKVPVMGSQAHGGHPAAASRPGTLTYKFTTTNGGHRLGMARASTGGLGWYDVHAEGWGATLQDRSQLAGTRGSHNDPAMASYSPNYTF